MIRNINFQSSMIRKMTVLAEKYNAINLAQGFPEHTKTEIINMAVRSIRDDHNQYTVTDGLPILRKRIAEKLKVERGIDISYENLIITCGASEAIMAAVIGNVSSNANVVIIEPVYENYIPAVKLVNANIKTVALTDNILDLNELNNNFSIGSFLILNTPHNPTGKVFSYDELSNIAEIVNEREGYVIVDETYEHLVYSKKHYSIVSFDGMLERTITVGSFSKTYSITGWRLGYVYGKDKLMHNVRNVHDYLTICAPAPFQYAALEMLDLPEKYYKDFVESYRIRRDFISKEIKSLGFTFNIPDGAYYIFAELPEKIKLNDMEFCMDLVKNAGVAIVPGSSFYNFDGGNRFVRFSFSKEIDSLKKAMQRLKEYLK